MTTFPASPPSLSTAPAVPVQRGTPTSSSVSEVATRLVAELAHCGVDRAQLQQVALTSLRRSARAEVIDITDGSSGAVGRARADLRQHVRDLGWTGRPDTDAAQLRALRLVGRLREQLARRADHVAAAPEGA